ncbi:MAG: hypothetical protein Q4E45_06355 [Eubacteriales bacterium]|nr:hypothetical protein [Eubacteriales bacterium]
MNEETYYIPNNFTDAGRVFGLFEIRNLIEALVLTLPLLLLCFRLLPFSFTVKLVVALSAAVPIGGFALIGVGDDSLTRWLGSWWRWRRAKRQIHYRGEVKSK